MEEEEAAAAKKQGGRGGFLRSKSGRDLSTPAKGDGKGDAATPASPEDKPDDGDVPDQPAPMLTPRGSSTTSGEASDSDRSVSNRTAGSQSQSKIGGAEDTTPGTEPGSGGKARGKNNKKKKNKGLTAQEKMIADNARKYGADLKCALATKEGRNYGLCPGTVALDNQDGTFDFEFQAFDVDNTAEYARLGDEEKAEIRKLLEVPIKDVPGDEIQGLKAEVLNRSPGTFPSSSNQMRPPWFLT